MLIIYLDGVLIIDDSEQKCAFAVNKCIELFSSLDFVINYKRSILEPKEELTFLGFMYITLNMTLRLPLDKRLDIQQRLVILKNKSGCTKRDLSKLIGQVAAYPAVKYGWVDIKDLEREKFLALKKFKYYDAYIKIPESALNFIHPRSIDEEKTIRRFLKGLYNMRPPRPKYQHSWDPQPVIECLKSLYPNESLFLQLVSKKLVMLLALTSGHRVQTLSKINVHNLSIAEEGMEVRIAEKIKTSGKNVLQPVLNFPVFKDCPELCVASVIKHYMKITQPFRRWLKDVLRNSGIETSIFSRHSTRHASTSTAFRPGVNIDTIKNTVCWTPKSDMFNRFYNRPLTGIDMSSPI
nr:unnamed protein product [Callosobruchus analis]